MDILSNEIKYLPSVGPVRERILTAEVGLTTWGDLLNYYPYKYVDRTSVYTIGSLQGSMPFVQIRGKVLSFEEYSFGARKRRVVAYVSDGTGVAEIVWWNAGKYVYEQCKVGREYLIFGKPTMYNGRYQFPNPDIELCDNTSATNKGLRPYYITTEKMKKNGLMSRTMERLIAVLIGKVQEVGISETLPDFLLRRLHLIGRREAYSEVHHPQSIVTLQDAQRRLKFEELFYIQLNILRHIAERRRTYSGYIFSRVGAAFNEFYSHHLPFTLTTAQKRVVHEIRGDVVTGKQMNRLLQGDVGSGKTLVALLAMLLAIDNGYQACMMAPTEILAEQHVATLQAFLEDMPIRVALLTGAVKGKRRQAVLDSLTTGELNILVGTHAIIEENVAFHRLGIAIIDEQHRFGVAQRARLWTKSAVPPHILVMTATPIPRTLAMTLYGDLDVSVIDELPPGRKPVTTIHAYDNNLNTLYKLLRQELRQGRQVYAVFPLIQESEKSDLRNLEQGYDVLAEVFAEYKVSKVHGKMKSADKEEQMRAFVNKETQLLVSTTVIEVGVNVPNASVMVIYDAQRFGLSQLHQLRGRVGRGADQSYCFLVTPYELSKETKKRIDIMCDTNDGFRIAEADLKLRGPGDLEGTQQSGLLLGLKIADIAHDGPLVELARGEAQKVLAADPTCSSPTYALLWQRLEELQKTNINWGAIS